MDDLYDEYYDGVLRMLMTLFRTKSTVNRDLTFYQAWSALTPKFTVCCRNMAAESMECARPSVRLFIKMTMIFAAVLKRYDAETTEKAREDSQSDTVQAADPAKEPDVQENTCGG